MEARLITSILAVFALSISASSAQDKNAKNVQTELDSIRAELKSQEEKLEKLAQQVAKLSAEVDKDKGDKSSPAKTPSASPSESVPRAVGVENPEATAVRTHTVAKGETLTVIAKQYGVSVEELSQLNRIQDAKKLQVGQSLKIPPSATPSPSASGH